MWGRAAKATVLLGHANVRKASNATVSPSRVDTVRRPSLDTFVKDYFQAGRPVIITDAMDEWPAATWTPADLRDHFGDIVVPVEISKWDKRARRWGDYRDLYADTGDKWETTRGEIFSAHQEMPLSFFVDNFVHNTNELPDVNTRWRAYLAQHQLLDRVPEMGAAVTEPIYIKAGKGLHQRNVWLGPAGMTTPLHQDPYYNLFAQISGRKYFRLYRPEDTAAVHPFQHSPLLQNTSMIDVEAADVAAQWPDFVRTPFWECELQAGDMLFVPRKWWHYVRAVDASLSVSFWWT